MLVNKKDRKTHRLGPWAACNPTGLVSRRGTATFDGAAIASAVLQELKMVNCPVPLVAGTWRIIPFSKWLITMVNESPK